MKTIKLSVLIVSAIFLSKISVAQNFENQNPYAISGKTFVLGERSKEPSDRVFVVENTEVESPIARLEHDTQSGTIKLFSREGKMLLQKQLSNSEKAWLTQDRYAEKYYSISPYAFCAGNPIRYVDINGDSTRVYTEAAGFGHTWISTREGDNMTVYSYGRYDGTNKGPDGSSNSVANGTGVLLRLPGSRGQDYNNEKAKTTGMNVFVIADVSDESVSTVLDNMFYSTENMPTNPNSNYYLSPFAHVIDEYKLTSNNCTTVVSDALNQSGSKVLYAPTIAIPNMAPRPQTFMLPQGLGSYLNGISRPGGIVYRGR